MPCTRGCRRGPKGKRQGPARNSRRRRALIGISGHKQLFPKFQEYKGYWSNWGLTYQSRSYKEAVRNFATEFTPSIVKKRRSNRKFGLRISMHFESRLGMNVANKFSTSQNLKLFPDFLPNEPTRFVHKIVLRSKNSQPVNSKLFTDFLLNELNRFVFTKSCWKQQLKSTE